MTDLRDARIVVTGGAGFLGRYVRRALRDRGVPDACVFVPRRPEFDLTRAEDCERLYVEAFEGEPVDIVLHLAAEVGGIGANLAHPGRYFYANMAMALHLIEQFREAGLVEHGSKFVQVGTICAYPKHATVPFSEDDLWSGYPEETNAPYGIAKRAAWQMLDAYARQYGMQSAYVLPVNLYGPFDDFDPATSHVIPALIRRCVEAVESGASYIECWGTGEASREFLFVDDAAEGLVRAAEILSDPTPVNLGTGNEIRIRDLVHLVAELTGFEGEIVWDPTKPDGQPRRRLDTSRAEEWLGFRAKTSLREGLERTIAWYREHRAGTDPHSRL